MTEARFKKCPGRIIQRLPRGVQYIVNDWRRCFRPCSCFASLNPCRCPLQFFFFTVRALALQQRSSRGAHPHNTCGNLISFTLVVIVCRTDRQTRLTLTTRTRAATGTFALQEAQCSLVSRCPLQAQDTIAKAVCPPGARLRLKSGVVLVRRVLRNPLVRLVAHESTTSDRPSLATRVSAAS